MSLRTAIHGYCREHREQVASGFGDALRAEGEVGFLPDPTELRPADVDRFMVLVDEFRMGAVEATGHSAYQGDLQQAPEKCPHCGGTLSWGTGPHASEARARGNAEAWKCQQCGAAGMLLFTR